MTYFSTFYPQILKIALKGNITKLSFLSSGIFENEIFLPPVIPEFFLKEKISGILLTFMGFKIPDKFRSKTPKFSGMTKKNKEPSHSREILRITSE